jgi:hypothetical protein
MVAIISISKKLIKKTSLLPRIEAYYTRKYDE